MTDAANDMPIADPAKQHTDADDTSIVPDMEADPVEAEESRTENVDVSHFGAGVVETDQ
jgi:hypothetical protein